MDEKAESMAEIKTKTFERKKEFAIRGIKKRTYQSFETFFFLIFK